MSTETQDQVQTESTEATEAAQDATTETSKPLAVGDSVYFRGYTREVSETIFKNGTPATITEETTIDGEPAFVIKGKKGKQDTVLQSEITLSQKAERMSKSKAKDAIKTEKKAKKEKKEKLPKPEKAPVDAEASGKIKLLTGADGSALNFALSDEIQADLKANGRRCF